jgi:hypothetical protein
MQIHNPSIDPRNKINYITWYIYYSDPGSQLQLECHGESQSRWMSQSSCHWQWMNLLVLLARSIAGEIFCGWAWDIRLLKLERECHCPSPSRLPVNLDVTGGPSPPASPSHQWRARSIVSPARPGWGHPRRQTAAESQVLQVTGSQLQLRKKFYNFYRAQQK